MWLGFCQCFATLAPLQHWSIHQSCYWALIDAANRLNWPTQHILILLCFYGSLLPVTHQGRQLRWFKMFHDEERVVEESPLLTMAVSLSLSKFCCSVQDRLAAPIRQKSIVLVWKSGVNSGVAVSSVGKGQLTSLVQKEYWGYWLDRKTHFNKQHWPVKLMVCMNGNQEILLY